jgi:hypothetical protein
LFCSSCGSKILAKPAPAIYCSICGIKATNPAARFCSGCESAIYPPTESDPESGLQRPQSSTPAVLSPSFNREAPRAATSASFAHDVIVGVDLLPNERILRITPCKIKSFTQVKEGVIYTTNQRIVCTTSSLGTVSKIRGKALVQGAKIGAKLSNQLLQEYLNESAADFDAASREEDESGWSTRRGPKGRKAEGKVAEALRMTGWKVVCRNIMLQAREIDIIAQKGGSKYLIECKFGKKQINTAMLDSYVMLYYDARKSMGVNGLLFVCPTAGMSGHAKGNVLIKYRGQNIQIVDSRNWVRELEAV